MQMRLWNKKSFIFVYVILICFLFGNIAFATESQNQDALEGRVLFISSYSYAWETVPEQIAGIQEALPANITIDYQFMDTKNINTPKSNDLFYQHMQEFMHNVAPYDVIITGDDDAYNFVLSYREELFSGIPVVFEGVNDVENALAAEDLNDVTGIIESLSYENTIALAAKLNTNATSLVAILDDTITGQAERKMYYEAQNKFPLLSFHEINTSQCSRAELLEQVSSLDDSSILLFILCTEDRDGNTYSSSDAVKLISQAASIPTFSIVSYPMEWDMAFLVESWCLRSRWDTKPVKWPKRFYPVWTFPIFI